MLNITSDLVLPNLIIGRSVDPVGQGHRSTSGLILALWNGEKNVVHDYITRRK